MASIGSLSFDIMRGLPAGLRPRVQVWQTPGLDGYGSMLLGGGEGEFDLITVTYFAAAADADTGIAASAALQGTLVTIVDDWGNSFSNVLVQHVETQGPGVKRPCIWNGNAAAVRVQLAWKMIQT